MKIAAVHAIANLAKQPVPDVVNEAYHVNNLVSARNTSSRNRLTYALLLKFPVQAAKAKLAESGCSP